MIDISTIISVISGILLTISECMPFIKSLESQGIIHFLINIGQKLTNESELQPLLNELSSNCNNNNIDNDNDNHIPSKQNVSINIYELIDTISSKINILNADINSVAGNVNSVAGNVNNVSEILKDINNDFKMARQLKLQTSELYQLNYIINYIKQNYIKRQLKFKNLCRNNKELLSSEGYIVSYDSHEDISVIGW